MLPLMAYAAVALLVFAFLSGLMLDPVRISFFIFYFVT
jgi:hypothetical protein